MDKGERKIKKKMRSEEEKTWIKKNKRLPGKRKMETHHNKKENRKLDSKQIDKQKKKEEQTEDK